MHNVVKWSNILEKSCGVHTTRDEIFGWAEAENLLEKLFAIILCVKSTKVLLFDTKFHLQIYPRWWLLIWYY